MAMLRAGLAVAAILIGAVAVLLGALVTLSALRSGSIEMSHGLGTKAVAETVILATEAARFWQLVFALGIAPAVIGAAAAWWGWRTIDR